MSPRQAKILSLLIFLLMVILAIVLNIDSVQKPEQTEYNAEIEGFVEQPSSPDPQFSGTRAYVEGTMLDEAQPTYNISLGTGDFWNVGLRFDVYRDCIVDQIGVYNNTYIEIYNLKLWDDNGNVLAVNYNLHPLPYKGWKWVPLKSPSDPWDPDITVYLCAGMSYIVTSDIKANLIASVDKPGITSDGILKPVEFMYFFGGGFPQYIYSNTTVPLVDIHYSSLYGNDPGNAHGKTYNVTVPDNYTTIQEAIDAASSGDSIFVRENALPYEEELTIAKSIELIGENRNTTVIDASGVLGGTGRVIHITADNIKVQGFTITGGDYGLYCNNTNNTDIRDNLISDNNDYGIYLDTTSNDTIINNLISTNDFDADADGYGIYALDSHAQGIWNNTISFNKIGVKIIDSWLWGCLNWNTFIGNEVAVDYDPEPLEIDGNLFIDNTIAIRISGDDSLLMITNNVISGSEIGIYVETGSPIIDGNAFTDNVYGIYYLTGSNPIIINNTFTNNEYDIYTIIPASLNLDPDTLNLKSKGRWITAYIMLPEGRDANDTEFDTISLGDGTFEVGGENCEVDSNICKVKFDRSELEDRIGAPSEAFELTVTGELMDGTPLTGIDTIRIICPGH